ncbi:MAG TPA: asparagine synthase (glutamine-hydrolyzing) [Candidatus Acidoferrum sp.]|jgi:asparagine synthase (glutamine-hydrolysing)|nr:asparagine synthase (glutamine-hydrolyzing) [Candidatus Acidoferrum sp.]
MCGICGVAGGDPAAGRDLVQRMCAAMVHRGPDDEGIVQHDGVALGMRRLSIIDLDGGHQPMHNEDSTVWVVQNGEIYNHLELRKLLSAAGHSFNTQSDTEVLVHGYEEWGGELVERLNGMYAFAVFDRRRGSVFLARDCVGIKPLHYAIDGGRLVFASELKALLRDPALRKGIDPVALDDYLAYEFVPSPGCIVRGIKKLEPGHALTWSVAESTHTLRRYWSPQLNLDGAGARGIDEECEQLRSVLRESVRKELISDVPLGVFLSGGIDSSAVAAMMTQLGGEVKSFSVGFADRSFDESAHARLVARHLGTEHHELALEPGMLLDLVPRLSDLLDEPLGDASIIPTYLLSEFTRRHVKVALGGDGGDELFAGYPTLQAHRLAGYYLKAPRLLRQGLVEPVVRRLPVSRGNLSFDFRAKRFVSGAAYPTAERHQRWMGSFDREGRTSLLARDVREMVADAPGVDPLNQVLLLDMRLYLENDILVKLDRASMMASLEGRVPMLNNDFVEYATNLPLTMKLRGLRSKFLLKRALRGILPDSILNRPKKGFGIPIAQWFRGPLKEQLLSVLSPDRIGREGFFDPTVVKRLIDDHLDGRRDNRKQLWTLFAFELWHDGYLKTSPSTSMGPSSASAARESLT